jgi:hypothetical protein
LRQPETVEYGKVYGVAVKDHRSGPPLHEPLVPATIKGNYEARKRHKNAINQAHPFVPTHKDGDYYVGFAVTHNPPTHPGGIPEPHVAASAYGKFKDATRREGGKTVNREAQLLTTPRHVAVADIGRRPKSAPESLDEGKFEELKKKFCKRGTGGCSEQSKKAANRKSSTASKVKAHNKATKSHGHASQQRKDRKGFAGKSKPMMKVKGPAGGRGTGRSKKGHK